MVEAGTRPPRKVNNSPSKVSLIPCKLEDGHRSVQGYQPEHKNEPSNQEEKHWYDIDEKRKKELEVCLPILSRYHRAHCLCHRSAPESLEALGFSRPVTPLISIMKDRKANRFV